MKNSNATTKKAIFIFSLFFVYHAFAATLKTVIGKNMAAPWYQTGKDGKHEGLTADYLRALEKKLEHKVEILVLPKTRIRIGFERGEIDFNCYTTPDWAGPQSVKFQWSKPLFKVKTILVSKSGSVKSIKSIYGQRVGTVLKYSYPDLNKEFTSGKLIRDEAYNEDANLTKLEFDRFKYALAEIHHFKYYLSKHPNSKIKPTGIEIDETEVRCWVRKGSPLKLKELNKAIDQIKKDGTLDEVFEKYFPNQPDLKKLRN